MNQNLMNNIYIHSNKWNFYNNADIAAIKSIPNGVKNTKYNEIIDIKKRIEELYKKAFKLEQQFYNDLETYSHITKEQFIEMYKKDSFIQAKTSPEKDIYPTLKRETSLLLNTQEIALLMAGIDKEASKIVIEDILKNINAKDRTAFLELYDSNFMKSTLTDVLYEMLNGKLSFDRKATDQIRAAFMGSIRANATSKTTAQRWARAIREKTQRVVETTANKKLKSLIKNKFKEVCSKYGVEDVNKYWNRYWEDYKKAIKNVTNKTYSQDLKISADDKKGAGDILEITINLISDATFNDLVKIEMVGSQSKTKELKNRDLEGNISTIEKTGQSRTDAVIRIYKDKEHKNLVGSYGIQAKNSFLSDNATIHLQSAIKLNTLLTTALDANIINESTYFEIFYLLANIFWFNRSDQNEANFMYTPRGQKDSQGQYTGQVEGRKIDENNIVNYVNILLQQVITIVLEPQITTELNNSLYKEDNRTNYGNVFYLFQDKLIPVSWFFKGMLAFIQDFENNQKSKNINEVLTIRNVSLSNLKESYGSDNPKDLSLEKRKEKNKLNDNLRMYPDSILNIGKRPGEIFYKTAKITGMNAYVNIQKLEEYYLKLYS